jgi:hypothetical protein
LVDIVRVLRILEYVGPRDWVETTLNNNAVPTNGERRIDKNRVIRSAILGSYPEILEQQQDGQENNESSGS